VTVLGLVLASAIVAAAAPPLPPERPPISPDNPAPTEPKGPDLPPYEPQVERLAELMGTLAYMRDLCGAGDGAQWRDKMSELLASEGSTDLRRDRLAGAFNRGLSGYAVTYVRCTPAAAAVITRSLDEAGRLTHDLASHFGG
jgi:uncharacterized protein (TIGR02301 family)